MSLTTPLGDAFPQRMQDLIVQAGYSLEEHFVETKDGYILGIYRIPASPKPSADLCKITLSRKESPPVLLQHGLLDSSATFVINHPNQSLGFILADAGYDVWLANSRGNVYSSNHTGFHRSSPQFWDFSFDDMAAYDLPATINYITHLTGFSKIGYIGHSQGSAIAFAALSSNTEDLRRKISIFIALAPAIYTRFISSTPLLLLARLEADQIFQMMGELEFLPAQKETAEIFSEVCRETPLACLSVLTAICGFNANNINISQLPLMVEYTPSGTSVKNMAHWAQLVRGSAEQQLPLFRRYDYGMACVLPSGTPRNCNRRMYHGSDTPPLYNVSDIHGVPIALFTGIKDKLSDPVDVESLIEALSASGDVVLTHTELTYEHLDFTWGLSAATKIYPIIVRLLRKYTKTETRHDAVHIVNIS